MKDGQFKEDVEYQATQNWDSEQEFKRQKRIKLIKYIIIFVVFQVIVITIFALTVMRVKSPKIRLTNNNVKFQKLDIGTKTSPAFDISFLTQIRIKNSNFGPYKYDGTVAIFTYEGRVVGTVSIPKGKVGLKSTKKINDVVVNLNSNMLPPNTNLGNELSAGVLRLTSTANMKGKVELMLIMKKNKSSKMDCIITIDLATRTLRDLNCK